MQWPPTRPGAKSRKFHLVRAGVEHVVDRNAHLAEDLRDFVDEGDVDVALRVLDHLGRLGGADVARHEHVAVAITAP